MERQEGTRPRRPHDRRTLALLVTPIVVMSVVGIVADAIAPTIIDRHPLLQIFLNPRNRYLVLAATQVDAVPFFVVGFFRLVLTDPLGYMLGYFYGDAALRWVERKLGEDPETGWVRMVERAFAKASYLIVLIAPNLYICILAGATGMKPRTFIPLNVGGTIGRLLLIWWVGDQFEAPINDVLDFIGRYRWWLLAISVLIVSYQVWRGRKQGSLETVSEIEDEIELGLAEMADERAAVEGQLDRLDAEPTTGEEAEG